MKVLATQSSRATAPSARHSPPWRQTGVSGRSTAATRTITSRLSEVAKADLSCFTCHRTLSNVCSFVISAQDPRHTGNKPGWYDPGLAQRAILRALHATEYVHSRCGRRSRLYRVRPRHEFHRRVRTGARHPHRAKRDRAQGRTPRCRVAASSAHSSLSSGNKNGAAGVREGIIGATELGAVLAGLTAVLLA